MKSIRRGLAVLLAALLFMPTLPASAQVPSVSSSDLDTAAEEVLFNTGNHEWSVVESDVSGNATGDAYFEEDGSYTINIGEANPFFPYEVQFTCNGEVTNEWFMTPDDSVEIGGHTFYVSAYFDNTVVTQMNLNVGGKTVVVYPEEKEFTNDGDGTMALSLLPLTEKYLSVDLSAFTPAELTMVSVDSIFTGANQVADTDKVMWTRTFYDEGEYTVSASGDKLDLSVGTYSGSSESWEMIVGEADQLAADNTRYIVNVNLTSSEEWLIPTACGFDKAGNRTTIKLAYHEYYDYRREQRRWDISMLASELDTKALSTIKLTVNPDLYVNPAYAQLKVYLGQYDNAAAAMAATDITAQICNIDATKPGVKFSQLRSNGMTIVTLDASGNVTGCLPMRVNINTASANYISYESMFERNGNGKEYVSYSSSNSNSNGVTNRTITLYKGYPANGTYCTVINYNNVENTDNAAVTAAYVGNYATIAAAQAVGAQDIKSKLCSNDYSTNGYAADYSQGVYFTIFVGADGSANQEVYRVCIKTEEGDVPKNNLYSGTSVQFNGLKDANGQTISSYEASTDVDSYADFNFLTIMVGPDTDLTKLAPEFTTSSGVKLYSTGSNTPEVSGKSYHDFSKGPVQYTASAEDGENSKNYWLQVVKATNGQGQLYVNSLADADAKTKVENGVIYSNREMMLDGYHNDVHDIWLANMGTDAIPALSAELVSDVVELDEYWTLTGKHELAGYSTLSTSQRYGELPNLAKLRIKAKDGVAAGAEISGTLTIKSGNNTLMVLTLTGLVGDPIITTDNIPAAVKYVPYGTMIQNNNKYSWNRTTYELYKGKLPEGMWIKPNGELYGVPTETGTFTFSVRMKNSGSGFSNSTKEFTMVVNENTDANVEAATDKGYDLTQRVQNLYLENSADASGSQTMVSKGEYAEFVDLYLDGVKLVKGTDYTSESGSTRITILNQTLARGAEGTHTLGVEFRTQDSDLLKRAAQNYVIDFDGDSGGGNSDYNDDDDDDDSATDTNSTGSNGAGGNDTNVAAVQNNRVTVSLVITDTGYTIQSGDTLWSISEKYYGSGTYWQKIYEDNKSVISDPDKIFAGQKLVLKPLTPDEAANAVIVDGNSYTVQSGDTLWKIAQKLYGKGWQWRKIFNANEDIIAEPEHIYVGQVLRIPE